VISSFELRRIMPYAGQRVSAFIKPLNDAMDEFEISQSPARVCAFLAQVAHESGELRYVREIASGEEYEGRADLGNTEPGDGVKFKGRGLIQITGRSNYRDCGDALGVDLISSPELLERPDLACRSAGWFWQKHGLNSIADNGGFELITRRINGGLNGYADRMAYLHRAQQTLGDVA
jgi:putative chitinase